MNLRNEIKEMLKTHLPIGKVIASNEELDEPLTKIVNLQANKVLDQATDQILSLLENSLPEQKSEDVDDYNESHRYAAATGWNACLEEIKEKMKGKSNE